MNALIGYSGFVGGTLLNQAPEGFFDSQYRSTNIGEIDGKSFDRVFCSGVPAQKWIANKEPEKDLANINSLIEHLKTIKCKLFVLISTVDVYKNPNGVDEDTPIDEDGLHAYGLNRRHLEKFVESHFEDYLIIRLPGLVGPGLRKNVIYDMANGNDIEKINGSNVYQFYPMDHLWKDIEMAIGMDYKLVNFATLPISTQEIAQECFNLTLACSDDKVEYNMKSKHAINGYFHKKRAILTAIEEYAYEYINI